MITIFEHVDVWSVILTVDWVPKLLPSEHFLLHLEDHSTWWAVPSHQILKGEDTENEAHVRQQAENISVSIIIRLQKGYLSEAILSFALRLYLVHLVLIFVPTLHWGASCLLNLGHHFILRQNCCHNWTFLFANIWEVFQVWNTWLKRLIKHLGSNQHLLDLLVKCCQVDLSLSEPFLLPSLHLLYLKSVCHHYLLWVRDVEQRRVYNLTIQNVSDSVVCFFLPL